MPPKRSKKAVATGRIKAKTTARNPTIVKRKIHPSRPAAVAAVKEATRRLILPQKQAPVHTPSASSNASFNPEFEAMQVEVAEVKSTQEGYLSVLEEIKERLEAVEANVASAVAPNAKQSKTMNGMTPNDVLKTYLPWIDAATLNSVVSLELDIAHFIKLIPTKERAKGQANAGLTSGVHFDAETGKSSIVNESNVQYEKHFPDYATLVNALTVYAAIRDLYDVDKLGFGCAITLYIRQLANWTKHHNWSSIISYFVSHFDKHQLSNDPRAWIDIDLQLFAQHMTKDTIDLHASSKTKPSAKTTAAAVSVCKNWNTKGCSWKTCDRLHVCQYCHNADHTGLHCSQKPKSS